MERQGRLFQSFFGEFSHRLIARSAVVWCGVLGITAPLLLGSAAPCIRLTRPGTQVQGEVKVCPGRYRVADPTEQGVIIVASSGTRLDLSGVTLESGDSLASEFVGAGVVSRGVSRVTIFGGTIRGYRYGIRLEGGSGHVVTELNLSGSRSQALRSTEDRFDEADWLDIFRPDSFERYGGGLLLEDVDGATVTQVTAQRAQNGIGMIGTRRVYLADNDVSYNSGWGIHLWRSSHNVIVRNQAHHNVRCESPAYSRGCDSAGILLRERSDSNVVADNDLTYSGDGFFLSGHRPFVEPSTGNLVARNNASFAYHHAFESTFSAGNTFLENRANNSTYGFWLGYSTRTTVRGNTVIGSANAGIAIEHGSDNAIADNVIMGSAIGIRLFARNQDHEPSRGYSIDDNVLADLERALVLEATTQVKVRGNVFDDVGDAITVDDAGRETAVAGNVFLRVRGWFISAPSLAAGSNYWALSDAKAITAKIRGDVDIAPWFPAAAAGF
ncbi:MAG TPA: right-handed parallel beta-helix repeat-containing protein [Gemmatimonadales bacterium]|nr:right-handed parallel beta-helix repeat-containing protein [Gemmatimonadales bacterium]